MSKAIIDGNSLYLYSRAMGISMDYGKLKTWLQEEFGAEDVVVCCAFDDTDRYANARKSMEKARSLGVRVFERMARMGNVSTVAQITAELVQSYCRDQDVVLWYGSAEIAPIVGRALTRGIDVEILGINRSVSRDLIDLIGDYYDMEGVAKWLMKA